MLPHNVLGLFELDGPVINVFKKFSSSKYGILEESTQIVFFKDLIILRRYFDTGHMEIRIKPNKCNFYNNYLEGHRFQFDQEEMHQASNHNINYNKLTISIMDTMKMYITLKSNDDTMFTTSINLLKINQANQDKPDEHIVEEKDMLTDNITLGVEI